MSQQTNNPAVLKDDTTTPHQKAKDREEFIDKRIFIKVNFQNKYGAHCIGYTDDDRIKEYIEKVQTSWKIDEKTLTWTEVERIVPKGWLLDHVTSGYTTPNRKLLSYSVVPLLRDVQANHCLEKWLKNYL